jgi:hypothetical protein
LVDVMLPLYLAATAISSGAYDRLLRVRDGKRRRYRWELEIGERITSNPLAGSHAIGFPAHWAYENDQEVVSDIMAAPTRSAVQP